MSNASDDVRARPLAVDERASVTGAGPDATLRRCARPVTAPALSASPCSSSWRGRRRLRRGPGPSSPGSEIAGWWIGSAVARARFGCRRVHPGGHARGNRGPADPAARQRGATGSTAPSDSPGTTGGSAAACTGTDNNRDFYADAANALAFDVYCPVLPRGWFVDKGEYHLSSGGILQISYRGPGGATLDLVERGPCQPGDDCLPSGTSEGPVLFGDRPAELVALGDGGWMVVAEAATDGNWWITGNGLDEAALTKIASDLARVGG